MSPRVHPFRHHRRVSDLQHRLQFSSNRPDKFESDDKWLVAAQIGNNWKIRSDLSVKIAFAYYDFDNIEAGSRIRSCPSRPPIRAIRTPAARPSRKREHLFSDPQHPARAGKQFRNDKTISILRPGHTFPRHRLHRVTDTEPLRPVPRLADRRMDEEHGVQQRQDQPDCSEQSRARIWRMGALGHLSAVIRHG